MVGGTTGIEPDKDTGRNQQSRCIISRSKKTETAYYTGTAYRVRWGNVGEERREVVDVNHRVREKERNRGWEWERTALRDARKIVRKTDTNTNTGNTQQG